MAAKRGKTTAKAKVAAKPKANAKAKAKVAAKPKAKAKAATKAAKAKPARRQPVRLVVGTKKGAFFLRSDGAREAWRIGPPHQLGSMAHHVVLDPRDRKTLLLAARTGHLGPTVFRSQDLGATWTEAKKPPA